MSIQAKESFKIIGAAHVILKRDNKVCMLRRVNTGWQDGFYGFPAGHKETGESFIACAIREAREEVGVELKEEDLEFVHLVHKYNNEDENKCRAEAFFRCINWEGDLKICEPEKSDVLRWFDMDNLPENTIDYLKDVINKIQKNIHLSEICRD